MMHSNTVGQSIVTLSNHKTIALILCNKFLLLAFLSICLFPAHSQDNINKERLDQLFLALEHSGSEHQAKQIEQLIWAVWFISENDQIDLILEEMIQARQRSDYQTALKLSDQIIELNPDYAEGWNQRATIKFLMGDYDQSLEDIVETLKREPRHFGALSGRAFILLKQKKNRQAIETINQALKIHPFLSLRHVIPNIKNSKPL